jgi:hypothetical protein
MLVPNTSAPSPQRIFRELQVSSHTDPVTTTPAYKETTLHMNVLDAAGGGSRREGLSGQPVDQVNQKLVRLGLLHVTVDRKLDHSCFLLRTRSKCGASRRG